MNTNYCPRCHKSPPGMLRGNSACGVCWQKTLERVAAAKADYIAAIRGAAADFPHFSCELHIGFLSLEETPEMLQRLLEGSVRRPGRPSRSKISGSQLAAIIPIDRVAARG